MREAYQLAQRAVADLETAVYCLLAAGQDDGLTNAEIGRSLGIYAGHVEHEGHIPRALLALLEKEGVVQQNAATKRWTSRRHVPDEAAAI